VAGALAAAAVGVGCSSGSSSEGGSSSASSPIASPTPSLAPSVAAKVVKVDSVGVPSATTLKVGDKLIVVLNSNSTTGHSWKVEGSGIADTGIMKQLGKPKLLAPESDLAGAPNKTQFTFQAVKKGTDQLELWYVPPGGSGDPGATYALIVDVGKGHLPVTVSAGDTIQATLPEQPSTGSTWVVRKPNPNVLKLSGKPQFKPNNDTIGAAGKTMYTFKVVGPGNASLAADYVSADAPGTPVQTIKVGVAAKPGFKAKTVAAVADYPSETTSVKPGDVIQLELAASAGAWAPQGSSTALTAGKPKTSGKKTFVTYTAKSSGNVTSLLLADGTGTWPNQAYAFTTVIGKGEVPKTVNAAARRSVKPVELSVGQTVQFVLPGNATTGYAWTADPNVGAQVLRQVGDAVYTADSEFPGSPGVFTLTLEAIAAGAEPLTLLYQGPGDAASPDGIYMTWVHVQ